LFHHLGADTIIRNMETVPQSSVGVLDRTMTILAAIEGGARTFTDVVVATGLTRSTAHRLLRAMEAHGLLTSNAGRGYRLGARLLALSASAARDLPLRDLSHPVLERLTRSTGESAQVYVREGRRRVCVDATESASELRTIVDVGTDLPLTAGSAGKVFLAFGPPGVTAELVAEARPLTPATPVGERLERELATARLRGWAASAGERQAGVGSVSAPVRDPRGGLVAVVSVSGPEQRLGEHSAARYAPAVLRAAAEIEAALGGPPG
jgi:DNA-binding IclR family transcriptional regulator